MTPDEKNDLRRQRAQAALDAYLKATGQTPAFITEQEICRDLMVDLCHWWSVNGEAQDFGRAPSVPILLDTTGRHYAEESGAEPAPDPFRAYVEGMANLTTIYDGITDQEEQDNIAAERSDDMLCDEHSAFCRLIDEARTVSLTHPDRVAVAILSAIKNAREP